MNKYLLLLLIPLKVFGMENPNPVTDFSIECRALRVSSKIFPARHPMDNVYETKWNCEYGRLVSTKRQVFNFGQRHGVIKIKILDGDIRIVSVRTIEDN